MEIIGFEHNIDTSIATLAAEIRAIDGAHKSTRVQMGVKILSVRALLREKHGSVQRGKYDAAGFRAPVGWGPWCIEHLKMSASQAGIYMNFAVDPEGMRIRTNQAQQDSRMLYASYALGTCRRAWPHLPPAERAKLIAGILELSRTDAT